MILRANGFELDIDPGYGGGLRAFARDGRDIFRRTPQGSDDILKAAFFALVPVCNRIADGRFSFGGHEVRLTPNLLDLPDFFHGHGWRSAWGLLDTGAASATLRLTHGKDEWPWPYEAHLTYRLLDKGLRVELDVKNLAEDAMPAGLGFHPYFDLTPELRLQTAYDGYWSRDAHGRPEVWHAGNFRRDWPSGDTLKDSETDHTFTGFGGEATVFDGERPVYRMTASPECRDIHVYTPAGADFYCLEPVTDRPDPFNEKPLRIRALAPGRRWRHGWKWKCINIIPPHLWGRGPFAVLCGKWWWGPCRRKAPSAISPKRLDATSPRNEEEILTY